MTAEEYMLEKYGPLYPGRQIYEVVNNRIHMGDVRSAYYDDNEQLRLRVLYFNGEWWPWEPLDSEVVTLR